MLCPVLVATVIVTIAAPTSDVNIRTQAGNPAYPVQCFAFVNAAVGATGAFAIRTGSGWSAGSIVYVKNTVTDTGKAGIAGSAGTGGIGGTPTGYPNPGGNGTAGTTGGVGTDGGTCLQVDANTNVTQILDNGGATLMGGVGGGGGLGGGGGGGAGGAGNTKIDTAGRGGDGNTDAGYDTGWHTGNGHGGHGGAPNNPGSVGGTVGGGAVAGTGGAAGATGTPGGQGKAITGWANLLVIAAGTLNGGHD